MFKQALLTSIYRPRRPRASPLWQIIHHGWDEFQSQYELHPLNPGRTDAPIRTP